MVQILFPVVDTEAPNSFPCSVESLGFPLRTLRVRMLLHGDVRVQAKMNSLKESASLGGVASQKQSG